MANEFIVRRGIKSLGGITFPQVTINSAYSVTDDDYMLDITGGTFNITIPSAVGIQGRLLVIKNNGTGVVNVLSQSGQTIDDRIDVVLTKSNSLQIVSNGSNWDILGYNISSTQSNTGVISFTGLTIASTSTFNVAPVKGYIVDDITNPAIPYLIYVEFTGGTYSATYLNTSTETYVYLTSGGTISQQVTPLTGTQRRQNISLGKLGHANKTSIINAFSQPDFVLTPLSQLRDMFAPISLINGGIYASPNGANLSINTSAGYLYGLGINFANDTLNPDSLYVSGTTLTTFQYRTQTGGTSSDVTLIDPTKYDVGGVITTLSGTKATNQRIYLIQNGKFRVQYGQTEYPNLSSAIQGLDTEQYTTFSNFKDNAILIGILSVLSSASDLSDISKARFLFVSKFGETVGTAGGISTTNLQQAYDNSSEPEIVTNSTLGAVTLQRGSDSDSDTVFEVQDGAGIRRMFVNASGRTTTTDLTITGVTSTSGLTRYLVVDTSGKTYYQTDGYVPYTGATANVNIGVYSYLGTKLQLGAPTGNSFSNFTVAIKSVTADGLYIEGNGLPTKILMQSQGLTGGNGQIELLANNNNNSFLRLGTSYLRESSGFLSIGGSNFTPTSTLHVRGASASDTNNAFLVQNSTPSVLFSVSNTGTTTVRGISNTVGNAFSVQNLTGTTLFSVTNAGLTTLNPTASSGDALEITNNGYTKQGSLRYRGSGIGMIWVDASYATFFSISNVLTTSKTPITQGNYSFGNLGAGFGGAYFNMANTYTSILGGYLHGIEVKNTYSPSSSTGIFRDLYIAPVISSGVTDWRGIEVVGSGTSVSTLIKLNNGTTDLFVVKGDSKIGFFGATPVVKQTLGVATAGATYTSTEQGMLQRVYDAIRTYGLGT